MTKCTWLNFTDDFPELVGTSTPGLCALVRTPRHTLSLLELTRAAAASGDQRAAKQAYVTLEDVWQKADPDLTKLKEIGRYLTR